MSAETRRYMRMLVFFDLPVVTKTDRRAYTLFRRFLLNDGYDMMVRKRRTRQKNEHQRSAKTEEVSGYFSVAFARRARAFHDFGPTFLITACAVAMAPHTSSSLDANDLHSSSSVSKPSHFSRALFWTDRAR